MPLTQKVTFKTKLQRGGRLQINRYVRWRFKLESDQYLAVRINIPDVWGSNESFLSRMTKDGRIVVPKLTMACLMSRKGNVDGHLTEVTLEPFG